ncbi:MAG TPA: Tat pathway signal sequence domain protein, partial [Bifidobacterium sp.]|nr:Tat pathway signal sequence domain protein [Bifidobacterium sp.]
NGSGNNAGSNAGANSGSDSNGSNSTQSKLSSTGAGVAAIAGVAVLLAAGGLIIARRRTMR